MNLPKLGKENQTLTLSTSKKQIPAKMHTKTIDHQGRIFVTSLSAQTLALARCQMNDIHDILYTYRYAYGKVKP